MTTCPTHQTTAPPKPSMPHTATSDGSVCKGCAATAGTEAERRTHHCPCCGDRFVSGCTGRPRRRTCLHCGTLDAHTNQWLPPADPILELLGKRHTLTPWFRAWEAAALRFGRDVAHHLVEVTTEIDQTHLYGEIAYRGSVLAIRYNPETGAFAAASDCPRRAECRRGRVWTPVAIREDLLDVRLNGPGPRSSACDRASRHS
ncbi:hypothetical protein ACFXEL_35110 [Streptomyces sp. NPDC059382]|uniref:hypothetical protein n=1 Tax=Streptomyces sp. NPDC059382 TaxID=3346816 RepID=UPI0036CAE09D